MESITEQNGRGVVKILIMKNIGEYAS